MYGIYVMTEEKENTAETTTDEAEVKASGKSGLKKYIMIGGGALVLIIGIVVVSVMFMGGDSPQEAEVEEQPTQHEETQADESSGYDETEHGYIDEEYDDEPLAFYDEDEFLIDADGPSVLDNITDNLAFLDYEPDEAMMAAEEEELDGMSVEDSIDAAEWLEGEKALLAEKEKDLASRERELAILDMKVSQKLLTLEQARMSRVNSLAKLYDGMDARSVAAVMANLDDATVVSILPRMKIKNASQVLSLFPPKRGAKLSKQMITIAEN